MKKKKEIILVSAAVFTLMIFIVGATYAYFAGNIGSDGNTNINVETATVDLLSFNIEKDIYIDVVATDFVKGSGNKSDSTKAHATLLATNSQSIESSKNKYNVYFVIEENDFEYTTTDALPEILLKVTDPNGNEVENITGLVHTENGFDITTRTGGFLISADYEITALRGESTTQDWNVEVTFVNLDSDQNKNMGKTLSGKLYMTKKQMATYELPAVNSIEPTTTYNSIKATMKINEGSTAIDKYYFGIEQASSDETGYINNLNTKVIQLAATDVKFVETDKPEYTFTNLSENTTYKVYSYVVDKSGFKSNIYETITTTSEYTYSKIDSISSSSTLNSITLTVNATKGDNEIVKYYYSKDNGQTYEESTSNSYIFSNLTDTTEYKIKVKVLDSYGRYSTEYFEAISTQTYILPNVKTVTTTTKWNEIALTTLGEKGTNNVSKYYYSINGGTFIEGSSTYTFTNLTDNTKYSIKVKVEDTNGKVSDEYSLDVTTDEYILPTITNVETSSNSSSIILTISSQNGDGTINKYYYSKDDGSNYTETTSNSYIFSGLTSGSTFYIKVYATDSNGKNSTVYSTSVKTSEITLADYIKNSIYTGTQGENRLYYHDGTLENGINDGSYRYAGASSDVDNYVCISDEETCSDANLFRIIGVFDEGVKLIKATSLGNYAWDSNSSDVWANASLNTYLNGEYLTSLGDFATNYIATTTWKVAGNSYAKIRDVVAATAYTNEITSPAAATTVSKQIGLMYASDYGFGADPAAWTTTLYNYNGSVNGSTIKSLNWLYLGSDEWLITPVSNAINDRVYEIDSNGKVWYDYSTRQSSSLAYRLDAVRPTFYLTSSVTYKSGKGTSDEPIRFG